MTTSVTTPNFLKYSLSSVSPQLWGIPPTKILFDLLLSLRGPFCHPSLGRVLSGCIPRGVQGLGSMFRPSSVCGLLASTVPTQFGSLNLTNPNPRDWLVVLSFMITQSTTSPYCEK